MPRVLVGVVLAPLCEHWYIKSSSVHQASRRTIEESDSLQRVWVEELWKSIVIVLSLIRYSYGIWEDNRRSLSLIWLLSGHAVQAVWCDLLWFIRLPIFYSRIKIGSLLKKTRSSTKVASVVTKRATQLLWVKWKLMSVSFFIMGDTSFYWSLTHNTSCTVSFSLFHVSTSPHQSIKEFFIRA